MRLQQVERSSVTGNAIANSAGTGLSMEDCNRVIADANQITWAGAHGITAVTCTQMTISSNQVVFPDNNGILIQGGSDIQVRSNFIKGPGRVTNNAFYAVRLSTSASSVALSGNKTRPYGSGNEAKYGLSITSTCSLVQRYGNDWRGSQWTGGDAPTAGAGNGINDEGSSSANTTATDLN
ncbi:right-handed parallel beta-helix repeat-containing protein [Streptomyces sp. NPDC058686]|uniref:right-handed parallel beta-helix repeat-containing protein n=1 Tax=Streptomyces sp. NPDC058686 TaxID=3346599 RepID=UPI00364F899C